MKRTTRASSREHRSRVGRRTFLAIGGAGVAGLAAGFSKTAVAAEGEAGFPALAVAPLAEIAPGAEIPFAYPDDDSPAILLRLAASAAGGVGPNGDIVAYSILCTHKGCPVAFYPARGMLVCPCHWSSFDPTRSGRLVIGQASQSLPQIHLRVREGVVEAVGVDGLIYGRQTNLL
jgi:arsenite oxidase small subunit